MDQKRLDDIPLKRSRSIIRLGREPPCPCCGKRSASSEDPSFLCRMPPSVFSCGGAKCSTAVARTTLATANSARHGSELGLMRGEVMAENIEYNQDARPGVRSSSASDGRSRVWAKVWGGRMRPNIARSCSSCFSSAQGYQAVLSVRHATWPEGNWKIIAPLLSSVIGGRGQGSAPRGLNLRWSGFFRQGTWPARRSLSSFASRQSACPASAPQLKR